MLGAIAGEVCNNMDSYKFPPLELLEKRPIRRLYSDPVINALRRLVMKIFNDKGITIEKMYPVVIGPSVYYFEIVLHDGLNIDTIREYLADYGLIRVVSLVYDNRLIAIELPRSNRQNLNLRDILETKSFQSFKGRLPIALGMPTKDNRLLGLSLIHLQHLLICGGAGTGKSMLLHCIILSLLYSQTPKELKLVLIDTKNDTFGVYNKIKDQYLYEEDGAVKSVITSEIDAVKTLYSLCAEIERRSSTFTYAGALPHLVVVIDEFCELMKTYGKHFEIPLYHLAQKGHEVGIHLVISTGIPNENVVTRLIKSAFPTQISFKLYSADDNSTILDTSDAELLIGKGDMLYRSCGFTKRVQGCFVDIHEIKRVCDWIASDKKEPVECHIQESCEEEAITVESIKNNCKDDTINDKNNNMGLINFLRECARPIESSYKSIKSEDSQAGGNDNSVLEGCSDQPESKENKGKDSKSKRFWCRSCNIREDTSKIMVLGIGGAGSNIIYAMRNRTSHPNLMLARYAVADYNDIELERHRHAGVRRILLHQDSEEFPSEIFDDVAQLIIVAGMNGLVGSKYSVIISTIALEKGVKSVFLLGILGFLFEGTGRLKRSLQSLRKISNMPGISVELCNMESLKDNYVELDFFSALEKSNELIIEKIERSVTIKDEGYSWNGYSIIGDKHELDELINGLETNSISKYDVINTLTLNGNNCVASSEGSEFVKTLKNAFSNLMLYKTEKLLLIVCCGCKLPSMFEVSYIYPILAEAGILDTSIVKFDIVKQKGLGNSFKIYIVASRDDSSLGRENG